MCGIDELIGDWSIHIYNELNNNCIFYTDSVLSVVIGIQCILILYEFLFTELEKVMKLKQEVSV